MNYLESSGKQISKIDDSAKEFQKKCLAGLDGKGIDIDTLYLSKNIDIEGKIIDDNYKFYFIEYLRDASKLVDPWQSNPNKYKWNWRKFYTLFELSNKVGGQLVLVNYSNGLLMDGTPAPPDYIDKVKLMYVESVDVNACKLFSQLYKDEIKKYDNDYIKFSAVRNLSFEKYKEWMQTVNNNSKIVFDDK